MIENLSRPPRPTPPQGSSGVPSLSSNVTLNFHFGYKSFEDATKVIDKIIDKYGGKHKISINGSIDYGDGDRKRLVFEDTYEDIFNIPDDNYKGTEIPDITSKIVISGIVEQIRFSSDIHNKFSNFTLVSLDCGNELLTDILFSPLAFPMNIDPHDYLKCRVTLKQCGSYLEPCYQLLVLYESDIVQHVKKNLAQETKENV